MLQTLKVKNLAIVDNVQVDFTHGLNVITGETGAGKSIIIGALGLVLGGRSDKSMIRTDEDRCGVEASFTLADSADVDSILEDLGMDPCDDGQLIIRRIISASGQNKVLINDSPATVQTLKNIGDILVDMHGPHDHQSLLNTESQLDILDSFGHLWQLREEYEVPYRSFLDLKRKRESLEENDSTVAQQIDILSYQVKEIEEANLDKLNEEELQDSHALAANAQQILEVATSIQQSLTDEDTAALNGATFTRNRISELKGILPDADDWMDEAESIIIQIQELSKSVAAKASSIEYSQEELQQLEDRMALVHKLKRKYGSSIEEILEFLEKTRAQLQELEERDETIARLDKELAITEKALLSKGKKLSKARSEIAVSLGETITDQLKDLGFPHGSFSVNIESDTPGPSGIDSIEFSFAPNVGETTRPLRSIASSGEISRVMLATKAVLAAHDRIPVLIFDEIDANVGGEMGNAIGSKLAAVAANHQVLCITHLPQVAVHGKQHFVVAKAVNDGRTTTQIQSVKETARAEEVARMLGGKDLTSVTLKHAEEMLKKK